MHTKILLIGVLLSMAFAGSILAQGAPAGITGIRAEFTNGALTVSWNPVTDSEIAYYRVYYSRSSILENGGNYDDYERTRDNRPTYTFPVVPYTDTTLYISVLAVNSAGLESDVFMEEASVTVETPAQSSVSSESGASSASSVPVTDTDSTADIPFLMTHALTLSASEVAIYFSKEIAPASKVNSGTVIIVTGSGMRLPVLSTRINGMSIIVKTEGQTEGALYTIGSIGSVLAMDGSGLLPTTTPVVFRGHPQGTMMPDPQPGIDPDITAPEDASNLRLRSTMRNDGTYDVVTTWDPSVNSARDLSAYALSISRDGRTYTDGQDIPGKETSVRYDRVQPGVFGVMVKARDAIGNMSDGVSKVITLPQTGVGLLGMLAVAGAIAGRSASKRKSRQ